MSDELNFNELSLSDVTIGGQPIVDSPSTGTDTASGQSDVSTAPASTETSQAATTETTQTTDTQHSTSEGFEVDWGKAKIVYSTTGPELKDDFIKGAVDYYTKTGDLTPYLQAKTVDFTKMDDAEIMRRNLREQYPDVSEKAFDRLYKQQVIDKYKLDVEEWGEDDAELGKELLRSEADKLRSKYIDWQKGFVAPEPQSSIEASQQEEEARLAMEQFERTVLNDPFTKSLLDSKRVSIKSGEDEFNYELPDANSLVDMTLDNNKFFSQFAANEGQLDYNKWYKTVAYSQNPEQFEKALINFGKTLGRAEVTKEIKNPSTGPVGDVPTEGATDFTSGLLQAFANRGVSK